MDDEFSIFIFQHAGDYPLFVLFLFRRLQFEHSDHVVPTSPLRENPGAKCELTLNLKPSPESRDTFLVSPHLGDGLGHSVLLRDVLVTAVVPELDTRHTGDLGNTFV